MAGRRWKLFFTDWDTFSSADGLPAEAPCKTVQIIVQEDGRCGRRILKFMDWYRWSDEHDRWFECEQYDVLFHLAMHGSIIARKGEYMAEAAFQDILVRAYEDPFIRPVSPADPPHPAWKKEF